MNRCDWANLVVVGVPFLVAILTGWRVWKFNKKFNKKWAHAFAWWPTRMDKSGVWIWLAPYAQKNEEYYKYRKSYKGNGRTVRTGGCWIAGPP